MYLGHIAGFSSLPFAVIIFLNVFGVTNIQAVFGISILLIAAMGIIAIEVGDMISSHFRDSHVILTYIISTILCFPALIYFTSGFIAFPAAVMTALPIMMASFLLVEGLSSFFIGD